MKITDPDIIKNGENDLIKAVMEDLDLDTVKEILQNRMAGAALSSKGGEIVVHNNEIAYRLDFNIQLSGSLMFDRQGNYLPESAQTDEDGITDDTGNDDTQDLISEDFDLDDINIDETLEEVAPQTLLNDDESMETQGDDTSEEEELSIDLPEYDLDDKLEPDAEEDEVDETLAEDENTEETDDLAQDDLMEDDIIDDDISDILQESREFWDQKKDS